VVLLSLLQDRSENQPGDGKSPAWAGETGEDGADENQVEITAVGLDVQAAGQRVVLT